MLYQKDLVKNKKGKTAKYLHPYDLNEFKVEASRASGSEEVTVPRLTCLLFYQQCFLLTLIL